MDSGFFLRSVPHYVTDKVKIMRLPQPLVQNLKTIYIIILFRSSICNRGIHFLLIQFLHQYGLETYVYIKFS